MFSYRHAFHAGNHADVLKHFVLIQLLQYMNRKDTAYTYIDTHAGAGVYQLDGEYAAKSGESATGIGPLWERDDLPEALAEYVNLVKGMNPSGKLRFYPGSPYCAEQVAREEDRLRMFEMHPTDFKLLTDNFRKLAEHAAAQGQRPSVRGQRALVTRADGFQSVKALLPPPSRRAVVLCDPPYEDKQDYRNVTDMLHEALKRFPGGTYAVWYPILQRIEARNFAERLKHLPGTEWLNVSLTVRTPGPDGFGGLHSSGMFIINPPYTLEGTLKQVMPYLVDVLGVDAGAAFTLESGLAATTPRRTGSPHADGPRAAASPRGSGKRAGPGRPDGAGEFGGGGVYGGGKARGGSGRPRSERPEGEPGGSGRFGGERPGNERPGMEGSSRGRPGSERMRDARPAGGRDGGFDSRSQRGGDPRGEQNRPPRGEERSVEARPQRGSEDRNVGGRPQRSSEGRGNESRPQRSSEGRGDESRPQRSGGERGYESRPPRTGDERGSYGRGTGRPSGIGGSGAADGGRQRSARPAGKLFAGTGRTSGPRNGPRKG